MDKYEQEKLETRT